MMSEQALIKTECVSVNVNSWLTVSFFLYVTRTPTLFTCCYIKVTLKKSKSMISCFPFMSCCFLFVLSLHVLGFDVLSVKVGNLFQMQDRNLWGGSDLSLCSSLFESCDPCCGLCAAHFPPLIFARLPVHHMNTASHSKLVFPECIYYRGT